MDYGTFFVTNIASVTVFAVSMCILALYGRQIVGLRWFAVAQIAGLAKLILQAFEGRVPSLLSSLPANELYLISIAMQWMGLRWFVARETLPARKFWIPLGSVLAAYAVAFLTKIPYTGNILNIPFIAICGLTGWTLLRYGSGPFKTVSRVTAVVVLLQMAVAAYRAALTNIYYVLPWKTVIAHDDPRWLYSLIGAAFLAAIVFMCELWFLFTELMWKLAEQALTDPLTGAMNRRAMEEAALRETSRSARYGTALSMIAVDVDNFKKLNDTRGHAAGDRALQMLVNRMKSILRKQDLLARMGGEEFAVLLPETGKNEALAIAERLRLVVESLEVPFETGPIHITVCAGVSQMDRSCEWEKLMRCADRAMYEAKQHGRNCVSGKDAEAAGNTPLNEEANLQDCGCVQIS